MVGSPGAAQLAAMGHFKIIAKGTAQQLSGLLHVALFQTGANPGGTDRFPCNGDRRRYGKFDPLFPAQLFQQTGVAPAVFSETEIKSAGQRPYPANSVQGLYKVLRLHVPNLLERQQIDHFHAHFLQQRQLLLVGGEQGNGLFLQGNRRILLKGDDRRTQAGSGKGVSDDLTVSQMQPVKAAQRRRQLSFRCL